MVLFPLPVNIRERGVFLYDASREKEVSRLGWPFFLPPSKRLNIFEKTGFELLVLWFVLPKWVIRSYNS